MRFDFVQFNEQFTDEELEIVWKWSGMGELSGDPEAPFPGREAMAGILPKFIRPIVPAWRALLRRAIRRMRIRRELAELRALLRRILLRLEEKPFIPLDLPGPQAMSPQRRCHRFIPARAP